MNTTKPQNSWFPVLVQKFERCFLKLSAWCAHKYDTIRTMAKQCSQSVTEKLLDKPHLLKFVDDVKHARTIPNRLDVIGPVLEEIQAQIGQLRDVSTHTKNKLKEYYPIWESALNLMESLNW